MEKEKLHRRDLALATREAAAPTAQAREREPDASAPAEARLWEKLDAQDKDDAKSSAATAAVENRGGGQPVDAALAAEVGAHMGVNLAGTRVHKDANARTAAKRMGARAFAHGDDIYLGAGESETDRALMAHELTHVAQQRGGAPRTQMKVAVGAANSAAETEADAVAAHAVGGSLDKQALVVDGGVLGEGQLTKAAFQAQLRQAVVQVTEQELGKIGATLGCPYIDRYFTKYAALPASSTELLIKHWIPATKQARSAAELIPPVLVRVREAVKQWSATRRLPPDLAMIDPDLSAPAPATGGKVQAQTLGGLEAELGEGQALDGSTAARMSRIVGDDVSGARIHTGEVAREKAAANDAMAFAVGRNVVMGGDAPRRGTAHDALLAHELAHVAQQKRAADDPEAREKPIGPEDQAAEKNANERVATLGNFAGAIGDVMRTDVQMQRCADWTQQDHLVETLGLSIDVAPAPADGKAMIVGQTLKLSLAQKNQGDFKISVYHWEAIDSRGNVYLHAPGETMNVQLIWPGETTLRAKVGGYNGEDVEYAFLERKLDAVRADTRATELVNAAEAPADWRTFHANQDVNMALLAPENKPSKDQPLFIKGGANPAKLDAAGSLAFDFAYQAGETVPSGRTYHWYAYPLASKDAPEKLGSASKVQVDGKDAYDLGTGQSARLATSHKGVYVIACHAFDGGHKAAEATFVQTVLESKEIEAVKDLEAQRAAVDAHMGKFATDAKGEPDVVPVTAFHVDAASGAETQMNLFIGKRADGTIAMINATPGLKTTEHRLEFTGSSTAGVLDDFDSNNKYPTGIVRFKVPGGRIAGVEAAERSIQTTGDTFFGHLSSALAIGGLVLSIAAIPFTGGGSMAATALFLGAAATGVAAGAFSLADHLSNEDFTTGQVALDCLQMAASFIDLGLAVKALKTSPALMVAGKSARYALWSSLAVQGASAVLISVEAIGQIEKILGDDSLSRSEKLGQLTKLIATLIVTGGLLVLSYKSLGDAKKRMVTHFGDKGKALKDLDAAALALADDSVLKTLKAASKEELERLAAMVRQDPALVTRLPGRKNVYGALKSCTTNEAAELERKLFTQRLMENGSKGKNVERIMPALERAGVDPASAHLFTDDDLVRLKKADDTLAAARSKRDADPEKATALAAAKTELDAITGVAAGTKHEVRAALAHVNGMPDPGYVVDAVGTIKAKFPKLKQPELDVLAKLDKDALVALENATEADLKTLIKRMQDGSTKDANEILRSYYYKSKKAVRGEKEVDAGNNVYEPPKDVGSRVDAALDNVAAARQRGFPHGFADKAQYDGFMDKVKGALAARGIPADNVHVHGSAIHSKTPGDIDVAVIVDEATFNTLGGKFKAAAPDKKAADAIALDMKKGKISSPSFYPKVKPTAAQDAGTVGALGAQVSVIKAGSEFDVGPYLNR